MKKRNLNKQKICEVAIQLIELEGVEGISMRKLAVRLDVEAASLYNHIKNKAELFDSIQEYLYSQMPINQLTTDWKRHLTDLAHLTREGLLQFPKVSILFATRPTITASTLQQVEITSKVLIKAGFKKKDVLVIFQNLHVFILGHVLAEVGVVPGENDNSEAPMLTNIDMDAYPTLKRISGKYSHNFNKGFQLGLKCMIDGLENLLRN